MAAVGNAGVLQVLFTMKDRDFVTKMKKNQHRMKKFGKQAQKTGAKLSRNLSLPLALVGLASVKMASDYDHSMTKIETLVGRSEVAVRKWRSELLTMGKVLGKTPQELAEALFFITSAGIENSEALNVLTMAAKASAVGLGETKVVADAIVSSMNAWKESSLSAAEASDVLVAAVRYGKMEASEFAGVLGRVTSTGSVMGVSFAELSAFIATFTRTGANAEIAATSLRGVLNNFLSPAEKTIKQLKAMGVEVHEVQAAIRKDGLAVAMVELLRNFKGNLSALGKLIPNVRALAGALAAAESQGEDYVRIAKLITESDGMMDKAFERTTKTFHHRTEVLKSQISALAITIGNELIPVLEPVMVWLGEYVDGATKASRESLRFKIAIGAVAIVAGPILVLLASIAKALAFFYGATLVAIGGLELFYIRIVLLSQTLMFAITAYALAAGAVVALGLALFDTNNELGKVDKNASGAQRAIAGLANTFWEFGQSIKIGGRLVVQGLLVDFSEALEIVTFGMTRLLGVTTAWRTAAREMGTETSLMANELGGSVKTFADVKNGIDEITASALGASVDIDNLGGSLKRIFATATLMDLSEGAKSGLQGLHKMFGKLEDGIQDLTDITESQKFSRNLSRMAAQAVFLFNAAADGSQQAKREFRALASQYGIFEKEGVVSLEAVLDRMRILMETQRKLSQSGKQELSALGGFFEGLKRRVEDSLDLTAQQKWNREMERSQETVRGLFEAVLLKTPGAKSALNDIRAKFGVLGEGVEAFTKAVADWYAKIRRESKGLSADATKLGGIFQTLKRRVEDSLAKTPAQQLALDLRRSREEVTKLWNNLSKTPKGLKELGAMAEGLGLADASLVSFVDHSASGISTIAANAKVLKEEVEGVAESITVNIGGAMAGAMDEMFTGFLRGTLDSVNVLETWRNMSLAIVEDFFSQWLKSKLDFDAVFEKNFMEDLLPIIKDFAGQAIQALGGLFGQNWNLFGVTPADGTPGGYSDPIKLGALSYASGGITTGPQFAMVGDNPSGREAIIPLERWGEVMGGGGDVSIVIHSPQPVASQKRRQGSDGKDIFNIIFQGAKSAVASDIMDGGPVAKAIQASFGSSRSGGR